MEQGFRKHLSNLCFWENKAFINFFNCVFLNTIYCSYTPSYPQSPYCRLCPWVLFPFCLMCPPPNPIPSIALILLSIYESVSILLISSVCSLVSTCEWNHGICLSLPGLFHLTKCPPGLSMLSQRVKSSSFLQLSGIPLHKCPILLSTHLLMDTWGISICWWM